MKHLYKLLIVTFYSIIFFSCSNEKTYSNEMNLNGNVKSILTKEYNGIDKNGNIEKFGEVSKGISLLNFNNKNQLVEAIIYNLDKTKIKELKKYEYNKEGKLKAIEETNDSKYLDKYRLSKFTYPEKDKEIEKWYNSDGECTYTWNTTFDDNSNAIITNSYKDGKLNWSNKYIYDNQNRLIESISYQKDSLNFNKNIITYDGLKETIEVYEKNDVFFAMKVIVDNENGDLISITNYNTKKEISREPEIYQYEYDNNNNWIVKKYTTIFTEYDEIKKEFFPNPKSVIVEREITYYE